MTLNIDQITELLFSCPAEKIVKTNVVKCRARLEAGNMAAKRSVLQVCTHHHRHGVPANQGANGALHEKITGHPGFFTDGDGVPIWGINRVRELGSSFSDFGRQPLQKILGAFHAFSLNDRVDRLDPLLTLNRINVRQRISHHLNLRLVTVNSSGQS